MRVLLVENCLAARFLYLTTITNVAPASIVTPDGPLNLAAVPGPSDEPDPAVFPATVETIPLETVMRRIRLFCMHDGEDRKVTFNPDASIVDTSYVTDI